jgi:hypothetical protein
MKFILVMVAASLFTLGALACNTEISDVSASEVTEPVIEVGTDEGTPTALEE